MEFHRIYILDSHVFQSMISELRALSSLEHKRLVLTKRTSEIRFMRF